MYMYAHAAIAVQNVAGDLMILINNYLLAAQSNDDCQYILNFEWDWPRYAELEYRRLTLS